MELLPEAKSCKYGTLVVVNASFELAVPPKNLEAARIVTTNTEMNKQNLANLLSLKYIRLH
jgi:hypothetical protein